MKQHIETKRADRNNEAVPLYVHVKQMVLDKIQSGEWQPNHRVPSETELVNQLGISKMTANRALRELASEGEVVRIQGTGTFVAERKSTSALGEVLNISDEIAARGGFHKARVVVQALERATPEVARALEMAPGSPVFHSLIVHSADGVPIQIEDRFVNPVAAPAYLEMDFTLSTPFTYLTKIAPLTRASHIVEAVIPQRWERKLLNIKTSEPCLAIRRRTWSQQRIVSAVRLICPGSRYRLESRDGRGNNFK